MSIPLLGAGLAVDGSTGPSNGIVWYTSTDYLIFNEIQDYIIWQ